MQRKVLKPSKLLLWLTETMGFSSPEEMLKAELEKYKNAKAISRHLGVSDCAVATWMDLFDMPRKRFKTPVRHNYDSSLTPKEIAAKYNVHISTGYMHSQNKRVWTQRKERKNASKRKDLEAHGNEGTIKSEV